MRPCCFAVLVGMRFRDGAPASAPGHQKRVRAWLQREPVGGEPERARARRVTWDASSPCRQRKVRTREAVAAAHAREASFDPNGPPCSCSCSCSDYSVGCLSRHSGEACGSSHAGPDEGHEPSPSPLRASLKLSTAGSGGGHGPPSPPLGASLDSTWFALTFTVSSSMMMMVGSPKRSAMVSWVIGEAAESCGQECGYQAGFFC